MTHAEKNHDANAVCPTEHQSAGRLTPDQIEEVKKFIEEAGGVDNARRAIEALEKLRPAA